MIIFRPMYGLANRMRSIASAWQLSVRHRRRLMVAWCVEPILGARFHKLFQPLPFIVWNFRKRWACDRILKRLLRIRRIGLSHFDLERLKPQRFGSFDEDALLEALNGPFHVLSSCNHFYRPETFSFSIFKPLPEL